MFAEIDGAPISREQLDELEALRIPLANGERSFSDIVAEFKLELSHDRLFYMSLWITPEFSPKRFATYFFAAMAPEEQRGVHDGSELVDSFWCRPAKLAEYAQTREYSVLPPTWINADHFARHNSIAEALDALEGLKIAPIKRAEPEQEGDKLRLSYEVNGIRYSQLVDKSLM